MKARDPHRFVNELDAAAVKRLIDRLENRAKDVVFTRLFDKYITALALPPKAKVLEIGCGTGSMLRMLVRRGDFDGTVLGIEQSPVFVDAARGFATAEGIGDRVEFRVGDAHHVDVPDASFDAVIVNTVLSHVTAPGTVLGEIARVLRPGGKTVVFDGDYASFTYAYPDVELGRRMDNALTGAVFNNPRIMRELAALLPQHGLELVDAWGDAVAEIGRGSFFKSFAEAYLSNIIDAGLVPAAEANAWYAAQQKAMQDGTFFASCVYYTFIARRP